MIECYRVAVTTTGSAGSATGSGSTDNVVVGKLYAVYINYHGSAPATTDVTIAQAEGQQATLLTVSDNATDGWYLPRLQVCSEAAAALTYDGSNAVAEPLPVTGGLSVSLAQSDALTDAAIVYMYVEV